MVKEIKYTGLTASPSDYEAPDGDLAACIGMVPEEGSLSPVLPPHTLFQLQAGSRVVFVHSTMPLGKNYIVSHTERISQSTTLSVLEWTADGYEYHPLISLRAEIYQVNAIGNTLLIVTSDGMIYMLWKGAETGYLTLGTHLPSLDLSFGLQAIMLRTESFEVTWDTSHSEYIGYVEKGEFPDDLKAAFTQQVLAKVNKFINEESVKKGRFIYPFFVRYAYRLYDGSLTMHSAPVLMITSSGLAPQAFYYYFDSKSVPVRIAAALHQLDFAAIDQSQLDELKQWSDIISSVDVFISKPIFTYDQTGECTGFVRGYDPETYSVCKMITGSDTGLRPDNFSERYQKRTFKDMYDFSFPQANEPSGRLLLPVKSDERVGEAISNESLFYFLKSFNLDDIPTSRTLISIPDDYLDALVTREVMTDDYDSHDTIIPDYAFAYNSRINLSGITKHLYAGQNAATLFCHTDGYAALNNYTSVTDVTYALSVRFLIKQDGRDIIVGATPGQVSLVASSLVFLYYPNVNAQRAYIKFNSQTSVREVKLQPHAMLNGAYYFGGWDETGERVTTWPTITDAKVSLPNKIYTSEVNNPFLFPVTNINTVGTGSILGLCTAAKALSQGQFGQFPLYAFSTDGVWALEVNASGGYSAKQPITRDVCINRDSITQLDSSVLFATDRGIMLISGSQSACISDSLDYAKTFQISSLPYSDGLLAIAGYSQADLGYVTFHEFIRGCRMLYSYVRQHIIVFNRDYPYAYVYSLKSKSWGMMPSTIALTIPSYPEALAQLADGTIVDYSVIANPDEAITGIKGLLVTRPLKLDLPNALKTVDTVIQRGNFERGHVKSAIYGSRDLINWNIVRTSKDHRLSGFFGTPYKYFRIVLLCDLAPTESIYGCTIQYTPRFTNRLR